MTHFIIDAHANIDVYPEVISTLVPGEQITFGDLHGNGLKLLYFLVRENIFEMSQEDYEYFAKNIYPKDARKLSKFNLDRFKNILANAKFNQAALKNKICLLGDELVDRAANDIYTILILIKLCNAGMPLDIILSNHGAEFLKLFLKNFSTFKNGYSNEHNQGNSAEQLGILVEKNLVSVEELKNFVTNIYKPHLKIINYTLAEDGIDIYLHAPIGFKALRRLAKELNVNWHANTKHELAATLDDINEKFQSRLDDPKFIDSFWSGTSIISDFILRRIDTLDYKNDQPPHQYGQGVDRYRVRTNHGHDQENWGSCTGDMTTVLAKSDFNPAKDCKEFIEPTLIFKPKTNKRSYDLFFINKGKLVRTEFFKPNSPAEHKLLVNNLNKNNAFALLPILEKAVDEFNLVGEEFYPYYRYNLNSLLGKSKNKHVGEYLVRKASGFPPELKNKKNFHEEKNSYMDIDNEPSATNSIESKSAVVTKRKFAELNLFKNKPTVEDKSNKKIKRNAHKPF